MVSFLCFYKTVILTFLHPHRLLFLPPYHLAAFAQQTTPKQRLTATVYSFTQSCRLAASRWAALALPVILAGVPYAAIVIRSSGGTETPRLASHTLGALSLGIGTFWAFFSHQGIRHGGAGL